MKGRSTHRRSLALGLTLTLGLILVLMAGSSLAQTPEPALNSAFLYQGQLARDGVPVTDVCSFQFSLWDAVTDGTQVGTTQSRPEVAVTGGAFGVDLDFGSGAIDGRPRWLEIAASCPATNAAYITLDPRPPLTPFPYALYTQTGAGAGLVLTGTTFLADTGYLQRRVSGECAEGTAVRVIHADGAVTCVPVTQSSPLGINADTLDGKHGWWYQTATNILSGTLSTNRFSAVSDLNAEGYLGNAAGDLALNNGVVQTALNADQLDGQHGAYYRNASVLNAGTVNPARYSAFGDLTAEGYVGNAAGDLALNNGTLQATLDADTVDGLHAGALSGWSLTGNTGTDPATNFVGTTDSQPLVFKTAGIERMRLDASGNVGINTNNPGAKLDVNGGAIRTDGQLISTAATGTAPLAVASTTQVDNLNADLLDGQQGSAYQARVSGACQVGSTVQAINADGTVACEAHDARPVFSRTAVDSAWDVGYATSVTIGADGLPVVSYFDNTNWDLKVLHCGNAACTAGNTATSVDTAGFVGTGTSIAIGADGLPVVSYRDETNADLKVLHCGNEACTAGSTATAVDTAGDVGHYTSIAIGADGLPVVSHWDVGNGDLKVLHCGNAACTAGNTATAVDTAAYVGAEASITIGADGLPVVSYNDVTNFDLKVLHCGNAACTAGNTATAVDTPGDVGRFTSIATGVDGLPVVSYFDQTNFDLKVLHCGNAACTAGNTATAVDTAGNVGYYTSIAIGADGLPVVSYRDETNQDLKVLHCGNAACTAGNTAAAADTAGSVGHHSGITIGADGLPVVSYNDATNSDLKVLHCSNLFCVPYWRPR